MFLACLRVYYFMFLNIFLWLSHLDVSWLDTSLVNSILVPFMDDFSLVYMNGMEGNGDLGNIGGSGGPSGGPPNPGPNYAHFSGALNSEEPSNSNLERDSITGHRSYTGLPQSINPSYTPQVNPGYTSQVNPGYTPQVNPNYGTIPHNTIGNTGMVSSVQPSGVVNALQGIPSAHSGGAMNVWQNTSLAQSTGIMDAWRNQATSAPTPSGTTGTVVPADNVSRLRANVPIWVKRGPLMSAHEIAYILADRPNLRYCNVEIMHIMPNMRINSDLSKPFNHLPDNCKILFEVNCQGRFLVIEGDDYGQRINAIRRAEFANFSIKRIRLTQYNNVSGKLGYGLDISTFGNMYMGHDSTHYWAKIPNVFYNSEVIQTFGGRRVEHNDILDSHVDIKGTNMFSYSWHVSNHRNLR